MHSAAGWFTSDLSRRRAHQQSPERYCTSQAISASTSIGLTCNGAAPTAIASATRPSILPVDLRLRRLPIARVVERDHGVRDAHREHRMIAMRELTLDKDLLEIT